MQDNIIHGRYLAELTQEVVADLEVRSAAGPPIIQQLWRCCMAAARVFVRLRVQGWVYRESAPPPDLHGSWRLEYIRERLQKEECREVPMHVLSGRPESTGFKYSARGVTEAPLVTATVRSSVHRAAARHYCRRRQ